MIESLFFQIYFQSVQDKLSLIVQIVRDPKMTRLTTFVTQIYNAIRIFDFSSERKPVILKRFRQ
jgi:hypothetical protein